MSANNAINNTLQSPFNVGATSVTSTGAQLNLLNGLSTLVPITKINVQSITATGAFTYTPTTGTQYAIFELQAGGGGSGGTTGAASQSASAGAGGGGGYLRLLVSGTTNLGAITGSVGIAGTAGTSGNNNGGDGGNTTLVVNSGSTWTAGGGTHGNGQTSSATAQLAGTSGAGGTNTTGTNATLLVNIPGQDGSTGFSNGTITTVVLGPMGGASFLGRGGKLNNLTSGNAGYNYGGGAGGGSNGTGANAGGTAGAQGIVLITEFISA